MKTKAILVLTPLLALVGSLVGTEPLGTAFTYQGQLTDGGLPALGIYDFRLAIYDAAGGGSPVAGPITNSAVGVSNGVFTTTLDFGPGVFTGAARWLEIGVRTNGSPDDFTTLTPRQSLTAAPYALFAPTAGTAGGASNLLGTVGPHQLAGPYTNAVALTHPANVLAGSFSGNGGGLSNVDADRLDGRDSTDFAPATHAHNAADITAGTLADARLSANIPRLNAAQTFTAANQFTHADNVFVGAFQGQGGALTNLDAGNITSGTLADARLSANIPRLNAPANFTTTVSAPVVQASNLIADVSSVNNAALTPGLILGGAGSGEGVASKRTAGGNQFGLDLFTAFTSRLAIANNGAIHIGAGNAFATYGDARSSIYVLRGTSSGASYAELFLPGNQRMNVPLNSTWTFRAFVSGRASNGKAAGYCFRGFLENEGGTVRLLESVNTEDYAEDDTAWDANLAASDYYDALVITARGNTGDSVRWTAVVYTVEVKW